MRSLVFAITLATTTLLAGAPTATAQHHTAGYFSVTWSGLMLKTDVLGAVTSAQLNTNSHYQCEMGLGNKYVLVADHTSNVVWQIDPNAVAVVGTLVSPNISGTITGMDVDHNGDLFLADGSSLIKVDNSGGITTITSPQNIRHMGLDLITGELIVNNGSTLFSMNRDGSNLMTLGTGFSSRYGDLVKEPISGDIFVPTCCGWIGQSLHVLKNGGSVASIYLVSNDLAGAYGPNLDRLSAATPRLITGSHVYAAQYPNSGGMWSIDLTTGLPSRIAKFQVRTIADSTILYSRNVQTKRTAPGKYDLLLSFDGEGNRRYVVGMSLRGVSPATPLPDQRRLPLVIDDLTVLTSGGLSAPFVTNTTGTLDSTGRAIANIDVSSIFNLIKGVRIWTLAVTLDSSAPLGIATIADPKVLVIE